MDSREAEPLLASPALAPMSLVFDDDATESERAAGGGQRGDDSNRVFAPLAQACWTRWMTALAPVQVCGKCMFMKNRS